jgi:hypothetical protein
VIAGEPVETMSRNALHALQDHRQSYVRIRRENKMDVIGHDDEALEEARELVFV